VSPALILDCDGVLADTERHGHLPAFNSMFAEIGLSVRWSEAEYGELVKIGGGKERLAAALTHEVIAREGLPEAAKDRVALIVELHAIKTARYVERVTSGAMPPRPGVRRLVEEAAANGWRLAVASTSSEASVRAVLEHAVGRERAADVAVFAGDVVVSKKPAPDIYLLAVRTLGIDSREVVVVEDSRNGLIAARGAGLATIITVSSYTVREDFSGAALVVSSLGDPPQEPAKVIADPLSLGVRDVVRLSTLEKILARNAEEGRL